MSAWPLRRLGEVRWRSSHPGFRMLFFLFLLVFLDKGVRMSTSAKFSLHVILGLPASMGVMGEPAWSPVAPVLYSTTFEIVITRQLVCSF